MKKLLVISLFLTSQILSSQTSYEFSTWLKTETFDRPVYGQVARTKKQALVPWKVTIVAISATTLEAVGDALYDKGKTEGNQNQMMTGKAFQVVSLSEHFLYIPIMKDSQTSWLWVPFVEALWRFVIFDAVYNLVRGVPIGYIGNTTFWDRGMQSFAPPAVMRLFADCIMATFVVKLTFDKF